jgi:hypothetical protein
MEPPLSDDTSLQDIKDFRQPMVTSLGIVLGFLLNFLGQWAIDDGQDHTVQSWADWIILITFVAAIVLMLHVLYRLLNNRYDTATAGHYYQQTFQRYMAAICLAFAGVAVALLF